MPNRPKQNHMDTVILDTIPFQPDINYLQKILRIEGKTVEVNKLRQLLQQAQTIAKPKAVYKTAYVDSRGDDFIVVDGVTLISRILRINLVDIYRVFPFVVTCGIELAEWANSMDNILERYQADTITQMALDEARNVLTAHISASYPGPMGTMSPGSLTDWPTEQQQNLFAVLGSLPSSIGVSLTDSFLMIPLTSVSGIRFHSKINFENCKLCSRERCPGRKAPYEPALYDERYSIQCENAKDT